MLPTYAAQAYCDVYNQVPYTHRSQQAAATLASIVINIPYALNLTDVELFTDIQVSIRIRLRQHDRRTDYGALNEEAGWQTAFTIQQSY